MKISFYLETPGYTYFSALIKRPFIMRLTLLFLSLLLQNCTFTELKNEELYIPPLAEILSESDLDKSDISIHVFKSKRILEVHAKKSIIRTYPIVLGGSPDGQKLMEGDKKTPEGTFKVRNLYPHKKWSKFIWFDYPNEQSQLNHTTAKAEGKIPSEATIGGEVGIHGVPEGKDHWINENIDWTLGCVSLSNEHMDDLYTVCQVGTLVHIYP